MNDTPKDSPELQAAIDALNEQMVGYPQDEVDMELWRLATLARAFGYREGIQAVLRWLGTTTFAGGLDTVKRIHDHVADMANGVD